MTTCVVQQTSLEMSTKQYPRKLLRAATCDSVIPFIRCRKRLLSEQNDSCNFATSLNNDETHINKRKKTDWPFHDSNDDNNHYIPSFSSLSSFENELHYSSSTHDQRRKSCTYINDGSYPQSNTVPRSSTTTEHMLVCPQTTVVDSNNENEEEDKNNSSKFITSAQLLAYITSVINNQNENILIIDCGLPLRYNERRIKESFLLNVNDKISRKRLISRGLRNFLDQNQLNRLDQSKIIILYDDSIDPTTSSCSNSAISREISPVMKCVWNELQRYDSNKTIYILRPSFEEFYQHYPKYCYISTSNSNYTDNPPLTQTTDIESYIMSEVLPGLYLGNAHDAEDMNLLKQNQIKSIINISTSVPCYYENKTLFDYFQLSCNDSCQENILQHFEKTFDYIHEKLLLNQNVLVHCQAGISRSPSFVIGYLMKYHSKTFDQAYSFVKQKRKIINPNLSFITQLTRYEQLIMPLNQ